MFVGGGHFTFRCISVERQLVTDPVMGFCRRLNQSQGGIRRGSAVGSQRGERAARSAMDDVLDVLTHWKLDVGAVREQMYRAPTPRERERWHAVWLLAEGWSAVQVAEALERDPHTIGEWVAGFRERGPAALAF